ncbi:MAG: ABC transporter permease [Bacteroidota bacterium]
MNAHPPKWINTLLIRLFRDELVEEIEGDLLEMYNIWVNEYSTRKANSLYVWHTIKFLRWYAIKKPKSTSSNYFNMYQNYFKIAGRGILKNKTFSLINISGLSIGLACCLMIAIYVKSELSYDRFHENADQTYRITREFKSADGSTTLHLARLAPPFLPLLKEDFPEMETMTRFASFGGAFKYKEKLFYEANVGWADQEFFKVFSFEFVAGSPKTALSVPRSIVITEAIALKYFGTTDALGKTISHQQTDFEITGVIKEMPENSHFHLDVIVEFSYAESFYGGPEKMMTAWGENNLSNYFVLKEGTTVAEIERRFPEFLTKHLGERANEWTALHVQRLTDIHLYSNLELELSTNSDINYVYTLSGIAILILLIVIINYMNLTTAKSINRTKEVGVRKVIGARKSSLVGQFLIESIVLVEIAALISILLVILLLPYLRSFTDRMLIFSVQEGLLAISLILIFGLIVGIIAGSYPALYLSSMRLLNALKAKRARRSNPLLRRSLVVVQFTISVTLIASTVIIFQQIEYLQNKEIGYEKDHILTTYMNYEVSEKYELFKNTLLANSSIQKVTRSHNIPTDELLSYSDSKVEVNGEMTPPMVNIINLRVDHDFLDTYDIKIKAGRDFDKDIISDKLESFIVNEATVKMVGWESNEAAIGHTIEYGDKKGKVIGVTEDVHFETLKNRIAPQIMHPDGGMNNMSIKVSGQDILATMEFVEETWKDLFPDTPFIYGFLDERFDTLYRVEDRRAKLFSGFSVLAIFLACLGLFGLVSFSVNQRSKETSVRKVLGATVTQITSILSREFILMVAVSALIGFPLTIVFMNGWLENYAYRIDIGYFPFFMAALVAMVITFITIGLQIYKAAVSNPVDNLRDE